MLVLYEDIIVKIDGVLYTVNSKTFLKVNKVLKLHEVVGRFVSVFIDSHVNVGHYILMTSAQKRGEYSEICVHFEACTMYKNMAMLQCGISLNNIFVNVVFFTKQQITNRVPTNVKK